jgi:hypothetical protein
MFSKALRKKVSLLYFFQDEVQCSLATTTEGTGSLWPMEEYYCKPSGTFTKIIGNWLTKQLRNRMIYTGLSTKPRTFSRWF